MRLIILILSGLLTVAGLTLLFMATTAGQTGALSTTLPIWAAFIITFAGAISFFAALELI